MLCVFNIIWHLLNFRVLSVIIKLERKEQGRWRKQNNKIHRK